MAPKTFNDLSSDLKILVLEQINRPSDLKNICLVNSFCHDVAIRTLYRTLDLDIGGPHDGRIISLINPQNKGLKYVKKIRLSFAQVRDSCNQAQQAQLVTRMILEMLPENILEEFSWCPWANFNADNLMLLYRRQQKLSWLEAITLSKPNVLSELQAKPALYDAIFQNVRKLAFYPEFRETLETCNAFVQKVPNLDELIIHPHFIDDIPIRELNDSSTGPGLITGTIFRHMLPFDNCTPLANLKILRLHKVHLRFCATTYCKIINFHKITQLRLSQCTGADSLLAEMCKSSNLPEKLELLEIQHKDNAENDTLTTLNGLLCLLTGIKELTIDLENVKEPPAAAGICRHGKTLDVLNIHAFGKDDADENEELVYSVEDFEKIMKASPNLQQLSCAFPSTSVLSTPNEKWITFARNAIALRTLITLNLTTWPKASREVSRPVYEHLMQSLSQRLFTMSSKPQPLTSVPSIASPSNTTTTTSDQSKESSQPGKLRLVAFGSSDKIHEREDSKHQLIFYKSKVVTPENQEAVQAVPIGWCSRQFVEPRSDILDYCVSIVIQVPIRDFDSDSDSD